MQPEFQGGPATDGTAKAAQPHGILLAHTGYTSTPTKSVSNVVRFGAVHGTGVPG